MADLTDKWYQAIRVLPDDSDEDRESQKTERTNSTISMASSRANIL